MLEVLYFSASFCSPCKAFLPKIKEHCERLNLRLRVIEVEKEDVSARKIISVPATIIEKDGIEMQRFNGTFNLAFLKDK